MARLSWPPRSLLVSFLGVLCSGMVLPNAEAQDLAIQGGKIIPIVGDPIDNGIILIRDGRIRAVGTDLEIPVDANVIDATGKVIMPGFVEPHSSLPLVQANEVNPNVPFISVIDAIDPNRSYFEEARRNGVTTVHVSPGNNTMIGGVSAVVKTAGTFVDEMILSRDRFLKLSLSPAGSSSRMSQLARLRRELEETKAYIAELEAKKEEADDQDADEDSDEEAEPDEARANLVRLIKGELPAIIYCARAMDVPQAIRLIDQYDLNATLVLGSECYKAVDLINSMDQPVILDPTLVYWETDPATETDRLITLPATYLEAGIPFAFQVSSGGSLTLGQNFLWYQAATAVKYGMPFDAALEALTLLPAQIVGVDKFVGSIEVGKDADLIILSGEPLQLGTWVETTIIDGVVVYRRETDERLQELLRPTEDD